MNDTPQVDATEPAPGGAELDHMNQVNAHPDAGRATVADEEQVLRDLYGEPGEDGIYRGDGA